VSTPNRRLSSAKRVSKPTSDTPRPRRPRTVTESLLSIVLVIDAVVLLFASLTGFGLKVLDPQWLALAGGAGAIVILLATTLVLRFAWGQAIGWVLQAALIALGILLPLMYVIGVGLALLWIWCFTRGRRIDASRTTEGENA